MPTLDVQNTMIPMLRNYFATQPVERAWLFGSSSRGEQRKDSDVDILVDFNIFDPINRVIHCSWLCRTYCTVR